MIRRPTWILLGILAVGMALAWYLEGSPSAAQSHTAPTATEIARLLPGMDALSLRRMQITMPAGDKIALIQDAQKRYTLEGQPDLTVDQGAAVQLASELASISLTSTLQSNIDEESIGLTAPNATITVASTSGLRHTIKIGSETPIMDGYYVQVDANSPAVVAKESIDRVMALATIDALTAAADTPPAALPGTTSTP